MEQYGEIGGMLTSYSPEWSKKLILEAYEEAGVDPASVAYVEADGSGIKVYMNTRLIMFCSLLKTPDIMR